MTRHLTRFLTLLIIVIASVATGCWDAREVNRLAFIGAMGIDLDFDGRPVLGVEILNVAALARGQDGARGQDVQAWLMLEPMPTYTEAIEQLSRRMPRLPYLGHVNMVIVGRRPAELGVGPWLDFLARTDLIRRSVYFAVCDTATGLLQRPFMEDLPSLTLEGLAQTTGYNSMSRVVTLNEFLRKLSEPGIEPVAMHTVGRPTHDIYVLREGVKSQQVIGEEEKAITLPTEPDPRAEAPEPRDPYENLQGSGIQQTEQTVFIGLGAFRGDRYLGSIDGLEARGFLWVTGETETTHLAVQHPGDHTGTVVLRSVSASSRYRPLLDESGLRMAVQIQARLEVEESTMALDLNSLSLVKALEQAAALAIMEEARWTLERVQQEFASDIYGFGAEIHRRYPRYWRQVSEQWSEVFAQLEVEINVQARVRSGGLLLRGP